jgi:hypothetical protein
LSFVDDGYSGSRLIRPALDRLRDQAATGAFGVHSPDRLARRYAYQVLLIDELKDCGVEVVFLNRQLSQGPEDDLLLQVQGVVAEYERAKILALCSDRLPCRSSFVEHAIARRSQSRDSNLRNALERVMNFPANLPVEPA